MSLRGNALIARVTLEESSDYRRAIQAATENLD